MAYELIFNDYFQVKLPQHWLEKPLQYLASNEKFAFVDGPFGSDLKSEEYKDEGTPLIQLNNIKDGQHIFNSIKYISEKKKNILSRHIAKPNDVVIAKMAEPVARATLVNSTFVEYVIVADCVKLTADTKRINLHFLVWAINSDEVRHKAEQVSTGTTRIRISLGELKKLKIPYPPLTEQTKIAQFLDDETAKIDLLIEKQQKLIELLKEKRQAVISHAVTKGLDPNVKMKNSGVEWLGDVPEHWEVSKLFYITDNIGDGLHSTPNYQDGTGYYFINGNNLIDGKIMIGDSAKEVPKLDFIKHQVILNSSTVLLSINGTIGKVAIYNNESVILGKSAAYINCKIKLTSIYLAYFLVTLEAKKYYFLEQTGTTIYNLSLNSIRNMKIPLPEIKEQKEIAFFLESHNKKFQHLIQKAEHQIELMKERRTALISAAVTGKIDVRDWQAPN